MRGGCAPGGDSSAAYALTIAVASACTIPAADPFSALSESSIGAAPLRTSDASKSRGIATTIVTSTRARNRMRRTSRLQPRVERARAREQENRRHHEERQRRLPEIRQADAFQH